jgi:tol-pal system protein YbgF
LAVPANNNAGTDNTGAALANTAGTGNNAIGGLSGSSTSSNTSRTIGGVSNGNTASNGAASSSRNSGRGTLQPAVLSEQQLYQMAYDSVINSNFERSLAEFDQYLSIYPQGRFVTNAHYWKGQAYLYLERFAEARDSYEMILEQYPDSAKLPDAMYGLGLAYQGLGNIPRARQLMNDIKRRFPNTGVANLADTRLLSLD